MRSFMHCIRKDVAKRNSMKSEILPSGKEGVLV